MIEKPIDYVPVGQFFLHKLMFQFIAQDVLPMVGVDVDRFWSTFATFFQEFAAENQQLLLKRQLLQTQIDQWHKDHPLQSQQGTLSTGGYEQFLRSIGFIEPEKPFQLIQSENVDDELTRLFAPQLVTPIDNARFAVNACNARWGSLYNALYSSDIIPPGEGFEVTAEYNALRGEAVVRYAKQWLDSIFPLKKGRHGDVVNWFIEGDELTAKLESGALSKLVNPNAFTGYRGTHANLATILLVHNQLHVEIKIDHESRVGRLDPAGIEDIQMEAALTTIMDCEDAVAAVDVQDKITLYKNWLGLMRGTLSASVEQAGSSETRRMASDRRYQSLSGESINLPGRSLMLIRNVGLHMHTDIVLNEHGEPQPEGLLDAVVTSAIGMMDVQHYAALKNSREGSIYIVKPKLHGSAEVAFTSKTFAAVEDMLGLPENTIKLGVMDEEKRTSLNLNNCVLAARKRIVFINTGFLDRTGDEIHCAMHAGPFESKGALKQREWFDAYEKNNVYVALKSGFSGHAQIGKGMWPKPDSLSAMLREKIHQLKSGATTAWVPSPIAAVLHAIHYHQVDIREVHKTVLSGQDPDYLNPLLVIPLVDVKRLSEEQIELELKNNAQSILGYVVRWIDHGVGCSKVLDIHHEALMEDRATLRISSQHMANWLLHKVCSPEQVRNAFLTMAKVVDEQNLNTPDYRPLLHNPEQNFAFLAALDLVFNGVKTDNGYTEEVLHRYRKKRKMEVNDF